MKSFLKYKLFKVISSLTIHKKSIKLTFSLILVCLISLNSSPTYSQIINFKLVEDNPSVVVRKSINLEYLTLDAGMNNIGGTSLGFGGSTLWDLSKSLTIDGYFRVNYYHLATGSGASFQLDGGLDYNFRETNKQTIIPYLLKFESNTIGQYSYTSTKYFNISATKHNLYSPRAGIILKSGYREETNLENTFLAGMYLGGKWTTSYFINVLLDGNQNPVPQANLVGIYADLLFLPVKTISGKNDNNSGIMGFRLGYQWYMQPFLKSIYRKSFIAFSVFRFEVGTRPIDGAYINASAGIPLYRE